MQRARNVRRNVSVIEGCGVQGVTGLERQVEARSLLDGGNGEGGRPAGPEESAKLFTLYKFSNPSKF